MSGFHIALQSLFAVISEWSTYHNKALRGANLLEEVQRPHFYLEKWKTQNLFNISPPNVKLHKVQEILLVCGNVWCFQITNIVLKISPAVVSYMRPCPSEESLFNGLVVLGLIQTLLNKIKGMDVITSLQKGHKKVQSHVNKLGHLLDV